MQFYYCEQCGNLIEKIEDSGVPVICCGQPMSLLMAGTCTSGGEKHVPVVIQDGNRIHADIGSTAHPMQPEHSIRWIVLETTNGSQRRRLQPGDTPAAEFLLAESEEYVAVYAYCDKHGLWRTP